MGEQVTDGALLAAVAEGNPAALEDLYRRHAGWLSLRLARRCADLGGDPEHAVHAAGAEPVVSGRARAVESLAVRSGARGVPGFPRGVSAARIGGRCAVRHRRDVGAGREDGVGGLGLSGRGGQVSEKAPTALYKRATTLRVARQLDRARALYQQVIDKYPRSPEAELAAEFLKTMK